MDAEKKNIEHNQGTFTHSDDKRFSAEVSGKLATNGVFFQCPMINRFDILPLEEWPDKIKQYIVEDVEDTRLQSILIIKSCNPNQSKVEKCIELLVDILEYILMDPEDIKFRTIDFSKSIFLNFLLPIKGAIEFLENIGFVKKIKIIDGEIIEFMVLEKILDIWVLFLSIKDLKRQDRIKLVLDRNIQVLLPSSAFKKKALPSEFFDTSIDVEIKMEDQKRDEKMECEIIQKAQHLEIKEQSSSKTNYKYCLIRVKFPDNLILQATFDVNERLSNLLDFIKESIFDEDQRFKLKLFDGRIIGYEEKNITLNELNLVPIATLLFTKDPLQTCFEKNKEYPDLKIEFLSLI